MEAISGTSAGAMNAAVFADGMRRGGREGAREALARFWRRVSEAARFNPLQRGPFDRLVGRWTLDNSPFYIATAFMARLVSPDTFGSLGAAWNPLRDILSESIDFPALASGPIKLFIAATNVRTGRGRVPRNHEISADVLLASACLPTMYQARRLRAAAQPRPDAGDAAHAELLDLEGRGAPRAARRDTHAYQRQSTRATGEIMRLGLAT